MTRRRARRLLGAVAVATAVAVRPAAPLRAEIIDRVLAVVGGQLITLSDVHAALAIKLVDPAGAADPIGAALSVPIERRLIAAEVDRYATPEPDEGALAARTAALTGALPADPARLQRVGVSPERVRGFARDELREAAYLVQRFGAVPADDAGAKRRAALIAAWVADLRRRTDVNVLYLPRRPGQP